MDMLINWETHELNIETFKKIVPKLNWTKKIRKLGSREESWYLGELDTKEKYIKVVVRPTMRMQISETYKNRLQNGVAPKEGQKSSRTTPFVDFGCTCQVLVDDAFLKEVKSLATEFEKKAMQKLSWSQ